MFLNDPDVAITRLEALLKRPLSEEEVMEISQFEKGRVLAQIVHFPGWDVAIATLESFSTDTAETLLNMVPGDPHVGTAHAAAYAARDVFYKFKQAIQGAIDASSTVPAVMVEAYKNSEMPADSV